MARIKKNGDLSAPHPAVTQGDNISPGTGKFIVCFLGTGGLINLGNGGGRQTQMSGSQARKTTFNLTNISCLQAHFLSCETASPQLQANTDLCFAEWTPFCLM